MTDASSDTLDRLLDATSVQGPVLRTADVEQLYRVVDGDDALRDDFLHAVAEACHAIWDDDTVPADRLGLRLGQWRVDLARQGVRAGLLSAVAATALVRRGVGELGVVLLTAILPSVFDIERVELSAGDRKLLVELRRKPAFREGFATEDELYASLPAATRDQLNPYDFADFVQRLREAGLVDTGGDDWLRLRDPDDPGPVVVIR